MEMLKLNFKNRITNYKKIIDKNLQDIYPQGPKIIKDPIYHILKGGKRIRPILCLITSLS